MLIDLLESSKAIGLCPMGIHTFFVDNIKSFFMTVNQEKMLIGVTKQFERKTSVG